MKIQKSSIIVNYQKYIHSIFLINYNIWWNVIKISKQYEFILFISQ